MASAASPMLRLPRPRRARRSTAGLLEKVLIAGSFIYMAVAVVHYPLLGVWSQTCAAMALAVGLSALWCAQLNTAGLRKGWAVAAGSILLLLLARPWLEESMSMRAWIGTLGCGLFVYAMIWVFAAHEREPGLQPLATAALILSIGVVAKPALVAACACLSLAVFVDQRREVGGWWRSTLLLLTPVLLCAGFLEILNSLWAGSLGRVMWGNAPASTGARMWSLSGLPAAAHILWLPLGILVGQFLEGRAQRTTLAYLFLVLFAGAIGTVAWMPHGLAIEDVTMVVVAGACSLLALDPPRHWFCQMLVLVGMGLALGLRPGR